MYRVGYQSGERERVKTKVIIKKKKLNKNTKKKNILKSVARNYSKTFIAENVKTQIGLGSKGCLSLRYNV